MWGWTVYCSQERSQDRVQDGKGRGIREWVQRVSPAVTTDALHFGKYDSITKTATFFGAYSQKSQSEQETGDVGTC